MRELESDSQRTLNLFVLPRFVSLEYQLSINVCDVIPLLRPMRRRNRSGYFKAESARFKPPRELQNGRT